MRTWTHDRWRFPLGENHRFPIEKYGLLRLAVEEFAEVLEAEPVSWDALALVHDRDLLRRLRTGDLSLREARGLGIPWSEALVERARRSVGGTVAAAREALDAGVALNLGGGTHHAGHAFARGYCLFNDVAVATALLRGDRLAERVLVVDCDVHQGDGTADIFGGDAKTFTLSVHGARNYPFERIASDLDVDLASGSGDLEYLAALADALDFALERFGTPDLAFYLAGADPWEGDRLGKLALSKPGLRTRDRYVLDRLRALEVPVCVVLAGGYADDVADTVAINLATALEVLARTPASVEPARRFGAPAPTPAPH